MIQEDEELLLKDLSIRLFYGVKITFSYNGFRWDWPETLEEISKCEDGTWAINGWGIHGIKPYLRPLSSMTKEERQEMEKIIGSNPIKPFGTLTDTCDNLVRSCAYGSYLMLQYLYSHHFDVINLIEKRLALEAPEGMYK